MTKQFDADSLFEPIEVKLGGKTYQVGAITYDMMDEVSRIADDREQRDRELAEKKKKPPKGEPSVLDLQLAIYLHCEPEELRPIDVRRKMAVAKFLRECVREASDSKNEPEASES